MMLDLQRGAQAFVLSLLTIVGSQALSAQPQTEAASILALVREATGGDAWNHVAELHAEGTFLLNNKLGTFQYTQNFLTGATVDRAQVPALNFKESHATRPAESWEQDTFGDVELKAWWKDRRRNR
jgi:hypothetical protein